MNDGVFELTSRPVTGNQHTDRPFSWARGCITFLILVCLTILVTACPAPPPPERATRLENLGPPDTSELPDKLALIDLLKKQHFGALETWLNAYQEAFEAGHISDEVVDYAFNAFRYSDPELETLLDKWVTETQGSYASLMSRSVYYAHLAGIARGYDLAVNTPQQRWKEMEKYELVAAQDASRALQANNKLSVAYAHLYTVSQGMGNQHRVKRPIKAELLQEGLRIAPHSVLLHATYLNSLAPYNGGSMDQIKAFIEAMERRPQPGGDFGYLHAYDTYLTANILKGTKRFTEALKLLDHVLAIENHPTLRMEKAIILFDSGRSEEALAELDYALELRPQSVLLLGWRASYRLRLGHRESALTDYDTILELDPHNPHYLRSRAGILASMKRYDEAKYDLDQALVYGSLDPVVHFHRGQLFFSVSENQAAALAEMERAIELSPDNTQFLYFYAFALSQAEIYEPAERQCRSASVLKKFQALCESKGNCPSPAVWTAKQILAEHEGANGACG